MQTAVNFEVQKAIAAGADRQRPSRGELGTKVTQVPCREIANAKDETSQGTASRRIRYCNQKGPPGDHPHTIPSIVQSIGSDHEDEQSGGSE